MAVKTVQAIIKARHIHLHTTKAQKGMKQP